MHLLREHGLLRRKANGPAETGDNSPAHFPAGRPGACRGSGWRDAPSLTPPKRVEKQWAAPSSTSLRQVFQLVRVSIGSRKLMTWPQILVAAAILVFLAAAARARIVRADLDLLARAAA